tara:strand:- start:716 stop:1024 length:309 start_codon:yes stop_codon:yes gene_type:complete
MNWKSILKEDKENLMDNPIVRAGYNKARDKDMNQRRITQRRKEGWEEDGHEIIMELQQALEEGLPLPKWAVVKDGEIHEKPTKEKFIDAKEDLYWSLANIRD